MKKIAFLFSGQGSQYAGMGKKDFGISSKFSETFEKANDILGYDLQQLCMGADIAQLTDTAITQPAVFTLSIALHEQYKDKLPVPQFMAGHSLGEYTALTCAGVLSFKDALTIVQRRGTFMKMATEEGLGTMTAINGLSAELLASICEEVSTRSNIVNIAAYNSKDQLVISGHNTAVEEVGERCAKLGATVNKLKVSAPFHSLLMANAGEELRGELLKYKYNTPACKILSNVTGLPYVNQEVIVENLTSQLTRPVKWVQCINYLVNSDVNYCIEIGPGKTLKNLLRSQTGLEAYAIDNQKDFLHFQTTLSGNINTLSTVVSKCLGISVSIKNNNYNAAEYQQGVVEPFRAIKKIQAKLEEQNMLPAHEDISAALSFFCTILNTKKINKKEKIDRLEEVLSGSGALNLFPVYIPQLN
ncbi:hypothetical protein BH09BAC6_BH09BAC6_06490 [soil metagenome]